MVQDVRRGCSPCQAAIAAHSLTNQNRTRENPDDFRFKGSASPGTTELRHYRHSTAFPDGDETDAYGPAHRALNNCLSSN